MNIEEHMDDLFIAASVEGRQPERWIMREADWLAMRARIVTADIIIPDPAIITDRTYRGIPVEFGEMKENEIVALVDKVGGTALASTD